MDAVDAAQPSRKLASFRDANVNANDGAPHCAVAC
jgi:hypothetical protein